MPEKRRLGSPEALLPPGEYTATCVGAHTGTSAAGNRMIIWTLAIGDDGGVLLQHYTVQHRAESGLTAQALGLRRKPLALSKAAGRQCRATVGHDGPWLRVTGVRPL